MRFAAWVVISIISVMLVSTAKAETWSVATGSTSGIYYPFGGGLAAIWSEHNPELNIKAEVTNGSVANLIQVARGESEAGISQGDAFRTAIEGAGRFPYKLDIAVLFALYPNLVHVIVPADSSIKTLDDLVGKRVSIGAPGSGNMVTSRNVLDALGIGVMGIIPYYLSYTETANALRDGTIDAGFIVAGIGVSAVAELAVTRDIRLLPFSDGDMGRVSEAFPAYKGFTVPAGLYKNVNAPVQTVSLWNFLIVNRHMPDDIAYTMTKTAFEQHARLQQIVHPAVYMTPPNTCLYAWDYLHPGAKRYFTELQSCEGNTP